jgi:CBS domain-containing protein
VGSARVKDVMTDNLLLVLPDAPIEHVWTQLSENGSRPFLVGSKELLVGIVPRSEVEKAVKAGRGAEPLSALDIRKSNSHVYPDQPIDLALEKLAQTSGVVPVLSRHGQNLLGAVTKDTVMRPSRSDTEPA